MNTYRIASTPIVYTPGIFAYIFQSGLPANTQRNLLLACSLPSEAVEALLDGKAKWEETENETVTVTIN